MACFFQLLVLAVHRQEVLGRGEGQNELLLLLAGVAGHMHVVHGFINDLGPSSSRPFTTLVTIFRCPEWAWPR